MEHTLIQAVIDAEQQLRSAMVCSNIETLHDLLADELIFINHLGHRVSKQEDIALHQSGLLSITSIALSGMQVHAYGDCGLVHVNADITANYQGAESNGCFAFSRVWLKKGQKVQVISAQSTPVVA
ncbi:nuclear transport factor 2 family protein [Pseudoalteromonas aurantia]|uniref:DUF4440 domain-containing protein n=1 Tax=Pseudoalteromonas aurantia 208 TaxID=1314867 RepID=A0ABR9EAW5_9GAMM|nr:nuclear transport factor 2 family protein [Pseudoalteromonas aurantia]MBE0368123.1 hypothetical protein [Pseudoalteromonas aurantia 208]